jgi:hypothetical protein
MEYLSTDEYESYGLSAMTPQSLVASASALVDAHCRRPTLAVAQYVERLRVSAGRRVRLSYLPLAAAQGATSAIVSVRARYSGNGDACNELAREVLSAFRLPGTWVAVDVSGMDVFEQAGELTLWTNPLGLPFDEVEVTYTAGLDPMIEAVKHACAMVVRNAQATPALNVRASAVDRMHMDYFSDSLLDSNVKKLLAPYVAQKAG